MARELTVRIGEEVDYRREATTIAKFGELYRGHPFIRIPEVISEASIDRVLTMTYLDGMDFSAAQHADQELRNTWAEIIIRFGYGNIRHANLLHADPHPGNYRFNTDGTVGFVDFGCIKVLPERWRRLWVIIMRAVIEERRGDLRAAMVHAGFITDDSTLTGEELQEFYSQVFYEIVIAPQPATYSPDSGARSARWLFGLDSTNPLSRMNVSEEYVFVPRVQQAWSNVCGALHATLPARAIADDMDGVAEPTTRLGKLHHGWVRERGLPSAFDDREAVAGSLQR
jgi:hypothetical protein